MNRPDSMAENVPKIALQLRTWSCGLLKKLWLRNCGVGVAEQHFFKSCGISIAEVLPLSCGIAIADSKKSCACPPLQICRRKLMHASSKTYIHAITQEKYAYRCNYVKSQLFPHFFKSVMYRWLLQIKTNLHFSSNLQKSGAVYPCKLRVSLKHIPGHMS